MPLIHSAEDIMALTEEMGFLPLFRNAVDGFSVEDCCPSELWFAEDRDGPWEWKGPIARSGRCAYGKFFGGKAGFVSREWLPDFMNFRRDGYDFEGFYEDGHASRKDKEIMETLAANGALLSKELKRLCDYRKGGNKGFDTVMTRLQMQTFVIIGDFVYERDRLGRTYGWGVAQYTTPEAFFGEDFVDSVGSRSPEESRARILAQMEKVLPNAEKTKVYKLLT